MRKFRLFALIIITMFLVFGCSKSSQANNVVKDDIIYASSIEISKEEYVFTINKEINLSAFGLTIKPSNANVDCSFSLSNNKIATIKDNKIKFISIGTVELIVSIASSKSSIISDTATITVVEENPTIDTIYATDISTEYDFVSINYDEIKTNKLSISPVDYSGNIMINYKNHIVEYDYTTETITPLGVGTDVITIFVQVGNNEYKSHQFKVEVTNKIYAKEINNVRFNNNKIEDEITIFLDAEFRISYDILPSTFNQNTSVEVTNNIITREGDCFTAVNTGTCRLVITADGKTDKVFKLITINVVEIESQAIEILIEDDDYIFTNHNYDVVVKTQIDDYDLLKYTLDGVTYNNIEDKKFTLNFSTSGQYEMTIMTEYIDDINHSVSYSYTFNIDVFNTIDDINFMLFNVSEIIPNNNVYTLYLPNTEKMEDAISEDALVFADISISAKGVDIVDEMLDYYVEGNSIEIVENKLFSKSLGMSKLIVVSNDTGCFYREYSINVEKLPVTSIETDSDNVTLYLDSDDDVTYLLNYSVLPQYAFDTNVEVQYDENYFAYENNTLTALKDGSTSVILRIGDISKTINFNIIPAPTHICAYVDNVIVEDNEIIYSDLDVDVYISAVVLSDDIVVSNTATMYLNEQLMDNVKIHNIHLGSVGNYNVKFVYDTLEFNLTIIVDNPIINFEFNSENHSVTADFTTQDRVDYNAIYKYTNYDTTDILTFESSNTNILIIDNGFIKYLGSGDATIVAKVNGEVVDTLSVSVLYKEFYFINSTEDFLNIESDKNYIVSSNLDFANITFSPIDYNGTIDFNNNSITNLTCSLFNTLGQDACVKNINLCINDTINDSSENYSNFYFVCNKNGGTIDSINIENTAITYNADSLYISLICYENNGNINNVNFDNVIVTGNGQNQTFSSICYINNGLIYNINGTLNINGFKNIGGVIYDNYGQISSMAVVVNYNALSNDQSINLSGVAYRFNLGSVLNNVDITLNSYNSYSTVSANITGLAYYNKSVEGQVVNVRLNGSDSLNSTIYVCFYINKVNNIVGLDYSSDGNYLSGC